MLKNTLTPAEFRRAAEAYQADLGAVDAHHAGSLGGPLGLIHAKTEQLGNVCMATQDLAPTAAPSIMAFLDELWRQVSKAAGVRPEHRWNISDVMHDAAREISSILTERPKDYAAIRPAIDEMLLTMESIREWLDTIPPMLERPH